MGIFEHYDTPQNVEIRKEPNEKPPFPVLGEVMGNEWTTPSQPVFNSESELFPSYITTKTVDTMNNGVMETYANGFLPQVYREYVAELFKNDPTDVLNGDWLADFRPSAPLGIIYDRAVELWSRNYVTEQIKGKLEDELKLHFRDFKRSEMVSLTADVIEDLKKRDRNKPSLNETMKPELVGFKNGTFNFMSGKLQESCPDDYLFNRLPYNLVECDETLVTEDWLEFLVGDSKQALMELIGYLFYRSYEPIQKFFIFTDLDVKGNKSGNNGKSTVLNFIRKCLGDNVSGVAMTALASSTDRFSRAQLVDRYANLSGELEDKYISEGSTLKMLTGNDTFTVENKGKDPFEYRNYAKLIFNANKLPNYSDKSNGFERRIEIIPFGKTLDDTIMGEYLEKFNLKTKIEPEIGKFVYKCLMAFRKLLLSGAKELTRSEDMTNMVDTWVHKNNVIEQFLNEYCIVTGDKKDVMKNDDLYALYKIFCDDNGTKRMSKSNFISELMSESNHMIDTGSKGVFKHEGVTFRGVWGVRLIEDTPTSDTEIPF